jgi:PTS system trehalose-specific IIC component
MISQQYQGLKGFPKSKVNRLPRKNQNPLQRAVAVLAEIFTPIIPAIIVGGLILGFRNVLEGIDFGNAVQSSRNQYFWNGVNDFLWLPGEAIFHFLPVGITWSITRKMGTTQILRYYSRYYFSFPTVIERVFCCEYRSSRYSVLGFRVCSD